MIRLPTVRDSQGRASHTLFFVAGAYAAVLAVFIGRAWMGEAVSLSEFGAAVMTLLAPVVAREAVKKLGSPE
ncbi:MAG: hypothetical protein EKK55_15015 [Rhodocyclaceae bacterium]|nr:MAG: hypothetical protein EKK55_15015 [Rhodocyclaceae bacterium]